MLCVGRGRGRELSRGRVNFMCVGGKRLGEGVREREGAAGRIAAGVRTVLTHKIMDFASSKVTKRFNQLDPTTYNALA